MSGVVTRCLQLLGLAALSTAPGCGTQGTPAQEGGCGRQWTEFTEDEPITAQQVEQLLAITADYSACAETEDAGGRTLDDLSCRDFCSRTSPFIGCSGYQVTLSTCEFDISGYVEPSDGFPGTVGDTVVGSVQCSGAEETDCIAGRRPLAPHDPARLDADPWVSQLAACAHMEAASVLAFEELAAQLAGWSAPHTLVERCLEAARDEARHAASLGRLVREAGAEVPTVHAQPREADLRTVAVHNAIEGCVSEAWAALVAHHQARQAASAELRAAYVEIAADETRHAQLAWDLHAWFLEQLAPEDGARVRAALATTIARLPSRALDMAFGWSPDLGHPTPAQTRPLVRAFAEELEHASACA